MDVEIAFAKTFFKANERLSKDVQEKVVACVGKFRQNPNSNGLNLETLSGPVDRRLSSVRVDDSYRMIVSKQDQTVQGQTVYVFVYVANHDDAYKWAEGRVIEENPYTGVLQDYVIGEPKSTTETKSLFAKYTDKELLRLGIPKPQLSYVRSFEDESDLVAAQQCIPEDVYEYLVRIVQGEPIGAMYGEIEEARKHTSDSSQTWDIYATQRSFLKISPEDDLFRLIREPLEEWRVFLHPSQRKIVTRTFNGPSRVLGGPGTGKTVVAMHRAKYLASLCGEGDKVFFTTYNTNLANDIKVNLRKICSVEEFKKIEVTNIDKWSESFLKKHYVESELVYDDETLNQLWTGAIAAASVKGVPLDPQFYREEWSLVVGPMDVISEENYLAAQRIGRGTPLYRGQRESVWKVMKEYMNLLNERSVLDIDSAMYKCRTFLKNEPNSLYKYVIVDEGQDLSNSAYVLIRALAGEEHENDLLIVGDSRQKIYDKNPSLSACGINIRGRSSILRLNYRTTEEIARHASALIDGISLDDMDDGENYMDVKTVSLSHGVSPKIKNFMTQAEEVEFVADEIKSLMRSGVKANDICIVSRIGKKTSEKYIEMLEAKGIKTYELKNRQDDRSHDDVVRIATMHRVKGLEFKYMFIVSANDGIIPLRSATIDKAHRDEALKKERCLLYVAMTRARLGVYITSFGIPSPFIGKTLWGTLGEI